VLANALYRLSSLRLEPAPREQPLLAYSMSPAARLAPVPELLLTPEAAALLRASLTSLALSPLRPAAPA